MLPRDVLTHRLHEVRRLRVLGENTQRAVALVEAGLTPRDLGCLHTEIHEVGLEVGEVLRRLERLEDTISRALQNGKAGV